MNNVIPIQRGMFLGDYMFQNSKRKAQNSMFFAGVLLTMVVPQITYCVYHGRSLRASLC